MNNPSRSSSTRYGAFAVPTVLLVAVLGVLCYPVWRMHRRSPSSSTMTPSPLRLQTGSDASAGAPSVIHPAKTLPGSSPPGSLAGSVSQLRQQFRKATDYGRFSSAARVLAEKGNPEAQYLLSRALAWCGQRIQSYFRTPGGGLRDLQDVQRKWEVLPAGPTDQMLATIFSRCRSFMGDPSLLNEGGTAADWLERAAQSGYPAAQAQKAADQDASILMNSARSAAGINAPSESEAPARRVALTAAMSGDPDAIFLMSDWVTASDDRSAEQTSALIVAWEMVACQQNYDCAPDADWMQNVCSIDRRRSAGQTYDDFFLREFGAEYDAAVSYAASISQALATQDMEAMQSFL